MVFCANRLGLNPLRTSWTLDRQHGPRSGRLAQSWKIELWGNNCIKKVAESGKPVTLTANFSVSCMWDNLTFLNCREALRRRRFQWHCWCWCCHRKPVPRTCGRESLLQHQNLQAYFLLQPELLTLQENSKIKNIRWGTSDIFGCSHEAATRSVWEYNKEAIIICTCIKRLIDTWIYEEEDLINKLATWRSNLEE